MNDLTRRLLGLTAVAAVGFCAIAPASAQWGYPAPATYGVPQSRGATYSHAPAYNPYTSQYPVYGSGYAITGQPAYFNAQYHLQPSPYGYPQPYGYGIYSERGIVDWDNWSPFGEREIEYEFRRNGTMTIDIDD